MIETGLIFPQSDYSTQDLVIAREYRRMLHLLPIYALDEMSLMQLTTTGEILEIGAFWSIRTKEVPSFDRYFSQLQTFYNDYR